MSILNMSQRIALTVFAILSLSLVALGQDVAEEQAQEAYRLAAIEAKSLDVTIDGKPLKLESEPLLRWTNPLSGELYGDVYIWTLDGRPEAIASIYKWFKPHTHLSTELQSLSESPLQMTIKGTRTWYPTPGIKMEPLPDAAVPHESKLQRTRQLRSFADQFKGEAEDRKDPGSRWFLRPLRQPIFRYQCMERKIVDGAMFAYCQGNTNNPEVLLMLEAREANGELKWFYGLGRQNSLRFRVYRNEKLIWDVPRLAPPWPNLSAPDKPYMVLKREVD